MTISTEYYLNDQNQLIRKILDSDDPPKTVQEKIFAYNIVDFHVTPDVTNSMYTLQLQAQNRTLMNQSKAVSESSNVYLRNL